MRGRYLLALLCVVAGMEGSRAYAREPLYVVFGPRGTLTFTSQRPDSGMRYTVFKSKEGYFSTYRTLSRTRRRIRRKPIDSRFDSLIFRNARAFQLEPELVKAVVHIESAFNPSATSPKGAMGLMQLMPGTAKRFGVRNAYRPEENVRGGTEYLKLLLRMFHGNEKLALAAYNAGENAVKRYGGIPPYRETRGYVKKVLETRDLYRCVKLQGTNCF